MPRKPRLFVNGGIYHAYCRTHRGELRFGERIDADSFIWTVADVSSAHRLRILAFALMSNHYHLVIQTTDVKLWRSMAAIHGRTTRDYNRRHRVFGPAWQSRYRARLIQDNQDLRHLLAYVHLNPVIAGLVDDPADYRLSDHRALIGRGQSILVDVEAALRCFGEATTQGARASYLAYVRSVAETKWARGSLRHLPWWKQVKDDYQIVENQDAPAEARTFDDKHPELAPARKENTEVLLARACKLLGLSPDDLTGASRSRSTSLARRRFTFIAVTHFRYRGTDVARALNKSPSQVSRWLTSETAACGHNPTEAALVEEAVVNLLKDGDFTPTRHPPADTPAPE